MMFFFCLALQKWKFDESFVALAQIGCIPVDFKMKAVLENYVCGYVTGNSF